MRAPRVGRCNKAQVLANESFPFPIGQSPFRIKGSGYLLHMQYVDEHLPGGRTAMLNAIRTLELRAFFEQTFFAGHFVDIYPLVSVGYLCADLQGVTFERFIRLRSRHQAEGDLKLFRKLILRLASPELLASRIPTLTANYFDFANAEINEKKTGAVTATMHGIPKEIAPWMTYVCEETVRFMLEYNGVKNLRLQTTFEREKESQAQEIVGLRSTIQWMGEAST